MSLRSWFEESRALLDATAGLVDGILTALILASGKLIGPGGGASINLAFRVGAATAFTTLFVFFVAHYAELRADIHRAERELNLLSHGKLAAGALGKRAVQEALFGSLLAALCGLVGALVPLLLCDVLTSRPWLGLIISVGLLGILGVVLAKSFNGTASIWALTLMTGGGLLTWIGLQLNIAS